MKKEKRYASPVCLHYNPFVIFGLSMYPLYISYYMYIKMLSNDYIILVQVLHSKRTKVVLTFNIIVCMIVWQNNVSEGLVHKWRFSHLTELRCTTKYKDLSKKLLKRHVDESIFSLLETGNWKGCRLWNKVSDAEVTSK